MAERPEPSYVGDQPFFFVSYGHADSDLVYAEMRWLQEAGFNLWYDEGIHVGSVWRKAIADALMAAAGMLFVATKSSVESDHCLKELSFVLDEGKPVFVVQLDDTKLPGLLRLSLADRQMLRRAEFDENTYRAKLIQALSTVAKPAGRPAAEAPTPGWAPAALPVTNNLPRRQSALIGREAELTALAGLLQKADLVTITGTGGVGKTRIAIEVGALQVGHHEDGVWLAELAPVSDPEQVPGAVARAMNIDLPAGESPLDALVDRLRVRRCLILLDNCEHVIDAVAALAEAVLDTSDGVKMLASSQELLGVEGEQVFRLRSLGELDAVALFTERAQAADAGFKITKEGVVAAAAICQRLDGIPLAIEMAAARAPSLGCEGVLHRLDDRFRVLTGGRRTALPRQRTLLATLDWSHGLLSPADAAVFRRLSIFTGGFSLAAALEIGADEQTGSYEVMDAVSSLVAKSLVVADPGDHGTRYRLLETTRAYGLEKLDAAGETSATQRRHAEYFLKFVAPARADYNGPVSDDAFAARYFADTDNIDRAIDWCFGPNGDNDLGIALVAASFAIWAVQSLYPEFVRWLDIAIARLSPATPDRVRATLRVATASALMMIHPLRALEVVDDAIASAREIGEPAMLAEALNAKGFTLVVAGRTDEARAFADESAAVIAGMATSRVTGQTRDLVAFLTGIAEGAAAARPLFDALVAELRSIGADGLANWFLITSSGSSRSRGDSDLTISTFRDVLGRIRPREMLSGLSTAQAALVLVMELARRGGPGDLDEAVTLARTYQKAAGRSVANYILFASLAQVAAKSGRSREAAKVAGYADVVRAAVGSELPVSRELFEETWALIRSLLPEADIKALREEGAKMSIDDAFRVAMGDG
jgi:predicted ATPase